MKTFFKVLSIIFGVLVFGSLLAGQFFTMGVVLAAVFGYFGWREQKETDKSNETI